MLSLAFVVSGHRIWDRAEFTIRRGRVGGRFLSVLRRRRRRGWGVSSWGTRGSSSGGGTSGGSIPCSPTSYDTPPLGLASPSSPSASTSSESRSTTACPRPLPLTLTTDSTGVIWSVGASKCSCQGVIHLQCLVLVLNKSSLSWRGTS
ncbi:hypothetical protein MLD38_013376 [Melastoma candidum]|uniref:Uncharacterized protein n=1 Tax=Melastoma candidum TaxID=119954 RepID=A0ACB9RCH1_9MYRT|nr:hypothetical protein MLD38_013376 [Melastoma candidum]